MEALGPWSGLGSLLREQCSGEAFKERRGMIRVAFQKDQSGCMVENVLEKNDREENSEGLTCGLDDSGHCGNGAE